MDERGPTISLRTKPAQLDKKRFDLEWHLPLEPGLPTHAALFDFQGTFPEQIAESEGGDEAETLLNLWTTLTDGSASADAIEFVADAYARRAGRQLERTGSVQLCFCNEGWICEAHRDRGWPHDDCAGPGMPCPR